MKNKSKAYFALIGVSEEDQFDDMLGFNICMKLDQTEKNAILTQALKSMTMEELYKDAEEFFSETERVFCRNSRWTQASVLNEIDVKKALEKTRTQCRIAA